MFEICYFLFNKYCILLRIYVLFFMMCDYSCCQCAPPPTVWPWSTETQRHSSLWNTSTPGWGTRPTRASWTSPVCIMNKINSSLCVLVLIIWQDDLLNTFKVHHPSNIVKRAGCAWGGTRSDKISLMIVEEFSFSLVSYCTQIKNYEVRKEIITNFINALIVKNPKMYITTYRWMFVLIL